MNKSIRFRIYVASVLLCLTLFASCSADDDTELPEGEQPMTFATAMEGSTATGTTTAGTTWNGGEQIAMKVEGSGVKQFAPVAGNLAMLAAADDGDTFYWKTSAETKRVSAWYVGAGYTGSLPQTWTVERDQSGVGYGQSDFLYATPTDISFSNRGSTILRFKHLPAKVVVHLKNGDGLTEKEVQDATVTLVNQAIKSGEINGTDGSVAQTAPGTDEITPNALAASGAGYLKSVQALLVPQQMQGKKFIKVTVGTGDAARNYYYTPTTATDADLKNGKQYAYEITVSKTGLSVAPVTIGEWTDSPISGTDVDKATFRVKLTGGPLPAHTTLDGIQATTTGNVYETTGGSSFSFSYDVLNGATVPEFTIEKGIAVEVRKEAQKGNNTTTYTYTCTNIRSDLWLNHVNAPAVGYYYYADGTWSSVYTDGEPACIGIVFWVGDATVKDKTLEKDHPGCTHGLVVALNDVKDGTTVWQSLYSSVQSWLDNNRKNVYLSVESGNGSGAPLHNIQGYNNTKAIEEFNVANSGNLVQAVIKAAEYRNATPAPDNSSKWYLPSAKELTLLYGGATNRDLVNAKLSSINRGATQIQSAYYWSSTESSYSGFAWRVDFGSGYVGDNLKYNPYRVRCVLAF